MAKTETSSLSKKIILFLKIVFLLISVTLGDLLIAFIIGLLYQIIIPTMDINEIMSQYSYQFLLTLFVSIYHIILICILSKKTDITFEKIKPFNIFRYMLFGGMIGLTYNLLINSPSSEKITVIVFLNMGIIGPILEEFLFRGWLYQKLRLSFCNRKAKWISTLIFAFFHSHWTNILYAFLLGEILIESYDRTKNFKIPIIIHIGANMTVILFYSIVKPYRIISIILSFLLMIFYFLYQTFNTTKKLRS